MQLIRELVIVLLLIVAIEVIKDFILNCFIKNSKAILIRYLKSLLTIVIIVVLVLLFVINGYGESTFTKAFLASSGLIIAVLTFTAQKTLGNMISGLALSLTKPFEIGDKVQLKNTAGSVFASGKIESINVHHIIIRDYTGDRTIITNSQLEESIIVNSDYKEGYNHPELIVIDKDSNFELAETLLKEILINHDDSKNKTKNTDIVYRIVDKGIQLQYNVRTVNVDDSFEICTQIKKEILHKFKDNNIEIIGG